MLASMGEQYTILLAEDSDADAFLVELALQKTGITNPIQRVRDGEEAIAYLNAEGRFADRVAFPFPEVIVLDIKMPKLSGLEVLEWIRDHPQFRVIPTIVMSCSDDAEDVRGAYNLGANTYFVKPSDFNVLARLIRTVHEYWELSTKPKRA
jgi:CheY-like chemotaxis protein